MTKEQYLNLNKQLNGLIKYIRARCDYIDYYADYRKEQCGYMVPRGVVIACDASTLSKIQRHASYYYPDMQVTQMDMNTCYRHMNRPCRKGNE